MDRTKCCFVRESNPIHVAWRQPSY
uniref:SFRICE_038692 n=1 Tax=Spodoptera frugiperda TaxID=7108 RepID=A0A2H1WNT3_SPOFR